MESTTERAAVRGIEHQLNDLLLGGRNSLPRGLNGRSEVAPPPRVAQTRKHIRQGLSCPFRHLLDVSSADVADGVPLSEVLAPYHRMIAYLEHLAADQHIARERPVPVLLLKAQKEIGEYELAALRLANSPESVAAAEAVIREAADIPPVVSDLSRACHLEVVRCSTRPTLTMEARS